jgi:hypothetical protein
MKRAKDRARDAAASLAVAVASTPTRLKIADAAAAAALRSSGFTREDLQAAALGGDSKVAWEVVRWLDESLGQFLDTSTDVADNDVAAPARRYTGEIVVGQRFVWEPNNPKAFTFCTVTRVESRARDKWVCAKTDDGQEHWNEEERFREACVPFWPTPPDATT